LRTAIPEPDDVVEAIAAKAAVAGAACVGDTLDGFTNGREPEPESQHSTPWQNLQKRVLRNHADRILEELGSGTTLLPVFPETAVQKRFLDACSFLDHSLSIGYHGTKAQNIKPISELGLLMPGQGGHKVANGSAHGQGIYRSNWCGDVIQRFLERFQHAFHLRHLRHKPKRRTPGAKVVEAIICACHGSWVVPKTSQLHGPLRDKANL